MPFGLLAPRFWSSCLCPLVYLSPKTFKLFGFLIICPWVYMVKVIPETCRVHWIRHLRSVPGPSWPWSYASWIYIYLCNQCLSPLKLWDRIPLMARCTRYNIM
jgi:hypothetical protein